MAKRLLKCYGQKSDPDEDFRTELRKRQGILGLMTTQALADAVGLPRTTLRKRIENPEGMSLAEARQIVAAAKPDPLVVLGLIGYSAQDIKALTKQLKEGSA